MATITTSSDGIGPMIQSLLQVPMFLGDDHVRQNVIPTVLTTIGAVSFVYWTAFSRIATALLPKPKKTSTSDGGDATKQLLRDRRLLAYQITNFVTNTYIGLAGLWFQYVVMPKYNTTTMEDKVQGLDELYYLGTVQIGFQIWSILVGIFLVEESTQMLLHHVAVIFASSKSVFFTNGFRYYAPLALGMTELSSVPLSVMNAFKNSEEWRDQYPQYYLASRLIFAVMFLGIRIAIFVPQHIEYLKYSWLVMYWSHEQSMGYRLFMFSCWLGAAFLMFLQLLWGYLIVKGLANFALNNHIRIQKEENTVGKKLN